MTARRTDGLGALLRLCKGRIVERWCQRVLDDPMVPEANRLSLPALRDHIPALLARLIDTLEQEGALEQDSERAGRRIGTAAESTAHARERFFEGYKLPGALRELSHLRAAIGDLCKDEGASITVDEQLLLNAALDEAMAAAADAIHHAAQAELRASEERYRLLVDGVRDYAIFLLDARGRIATWNPGAERVHGYTSEEVLSQPYQRFFTREDQATGEPERAMQTALAQGRFTGRLLRVRKSGECFWVELTLTPLFDEAGQLRGFSNIARDVTERVQVEQRLAESAARLAGIITSAKEAILSVDQEQRIVVFNEAAEKIFGVPAAEALGLRIERFIPERFRAEHAEHVQRFGETGVTSRTMGSLTPNPLMALRANGEEFPIEASISHARVGGQSVYTVVLRDVTEQLRAETEKAELLERERAARQAAEQSEFKFRRLADSGILGIIITTGGGAILEANEAFLRMVGYSVDDLRAGRMHWLAMTPPEFLPLDEQAIRELRQTGSARTYEKEYLHKDGSRVAIALGAATLSAEEDTYIAYVMDVTARKRTEAALHKVARERDETLALLDTFLASAPEGFAVVDRELRYLRINETLAALNGRPVSEHLGRRIREVLPGFPELEQMVQQVMDSGEPVLRLASQVTGPASGQVLHLLSNFLPLRDSLGRVFGVGAIVLNITDQARALEELHEYSAFRERLMAILGHDLRQPLSLIMMTVETWLKYEELPEGLLRAAQRVARAASRMGRMIADILDLTRIRQGTSLPISPRPGELAAICRGVVDEISMTRPNRQIELVTHGSCEGQWDPDRLAQVVSNLVTNALDYSPPDTPVFVEVEGMEDRVRMQVRNQGPPIPPELLPILFDPFRRGRHEARGSTSQGLGLGLHIAREVVRAHGGDISVRSEPAQGTVVTLWLPLATAAQAQELVTT